ncbi:hypothetical protein ABEM69_24610, partial [Escherichia coli]
MDTPLLLKGILHSIVLTCLLLHTLITNITMACQQKPEPDSGFVKLSGYFIPPIFSHVPSARRICSGL